MKKLSLLCIFLLLTGAHLKAQFSASDEMHIFNYTSYTMGGSVSAKSPANCYPALNGPFNENIFPTGDPLGRDVVMYKKYRDSHLTTIPISNWYIATSSSSYTIYPSTSPNLTSPFGTTTRWGGLLVEYWNYATTVNGGFGVNYFSFITGSSNVCETRPMFYSDANLSVDSFYIDDNYYVIIS